MPLVINSLGGIHAYTHTHTHTYPNTPTHTHTDFTNENNFKKPGVCWPKAGTWLV